MSNVAISYLLCHWIIQVDDGVRGEVRRVRGGCRAVRKRVEEASESRMDDLGGMEELI